jgi:hypothetical protein
MSEMNQIVLIYCVWISDICYCNHEERKYYDLLLTNYNLILTSSFDR